MVLVRCLLGREQKKKMLPGGSAFVCVYVCSTCGTMVRTFVGRVGLTSIGRGLDCFLFALLRRGGRHPGIPLTPWTFFKIVAFISTDVVIQLYDLWFTVSHWQKGTSITSRWKPIGGEHIKFPGAQIRHWAKEFSKTGSVWATPPGKCKNTRGLGWKKTGWVCPFWNFATRVDGKGNKFRPKTKAHPVKDQTFKTYWNWARGESSEYLHGFLSWSSFLGFFLDTFGKACELNLLEDPREGGWILQVCITFLLLTLSSQY